MTRQPTADPRSSAAPSAGGGSAPTAQSRRSISLGTRIVLVVGGLFLVFAGAVIYGGLRATSVYLEEVDQNLHRQLADHLVAEEPLLRNGEIQEKALKHVFHMLMVINPRIECYLLSSSGDILAFHAPAGRVVADRVDLEPVQRYLDSAKRRFPLRGTDPRHPNQPKVFSAAPIPAVTSGDGDGERAAEAAGYLYVVLAGEQYASVRERLAQSAVLRFAALVAVGGGLLALLAATLLVRHQTRRLRKLDRKMHFFRSRRAESSSSPAPPNPSPGDEIDRLELTFEQMQARIEQQIERVVESDRIRRELVANVSHDLRTPVASLQGYLETLRFGGDRLSPMQHDEYLEVAHAQSERLGRLVSELFELARLDSGDAPLCREPFAVAELAQDVVQKYRLRAREAGVDLRLSLSSVAASGVRVLADVRLIERVLENLIENALRYTGADGAVVLELRQRPHEVELAVRDTGCGIASEELPRIFDRFYRVRTHAKDEPSTSAEDCALDSAGDSAQAPSGRETGAKALSSGSGLGLAIARRVVEMHESRLWVRSHPGEGSTFGFSLATA